MLREIKFKKLILGSGVEEKHGYAIVDKVIEASIISENGKEEAKLKITIAPGYEEEAIIGRIFSLGLISSSEDILSSENHGNKYILKIKKKEKKVEEIRDNIKIKPEIVLKCMKELLDINEKYNITGAVHGAALFDLTGKLIFFTEDIGKVNAIDKCIGYGIRNKIDFSSCIIASTGRQIGAMIEKIARAGIPIAVSRGAPIYSSIEVARKLNITLICFARGRTMNIYAGEQRIELEAIKNSSNV